MAEDAQEDMDRNDSINNSNDTVIHNTEGDKSIKEKDVGAYVLTSCEVLIHRHMKSSTPGHLSAGGDTPRSMKRKAVMESSEDSSESVGIGDTRKIVTARRKKSIISSLDDMSEKERNPFDVRSLSEESSGSLISMHSVKKERKWSRITKEPSPIESLIGKGKSASIQLMGEKAMEWIHEVDTSRAKSKNLQGRTLGAMKNRLNGIKTIVEKLMEKASDLGDPAYLRQQNGELKKENKELKNKIKNLSKDIEKLQNQMSTLSKHMEYISEENIKIKKELKNRNNGINNTPAGSSIVVNSGGMKRPTDLPLNTKSKPRVTSILKGRFISPERLVHRNVEEIVADTKLIDDEMEKLFRLREKRQAEYLSTPVENPTAREGSSRITESSKTYRINRNASRGVYDSMENVRGNNRTDERRNNPTDMETADESDFRLVRNRRGRNNASKIRRAPRNAVVSIKADGEDVKKSYAEIIKTARKEVALTEYGDNVRVRMSTGGALMLELPGRDNHERADKLFERLNGVLRGRAKVTRPIAMGEARISNFDYSLTCEEIAGVVATAVGARITDFIVSPIREMKNRMHMCWIKEPLIYIDRLANLQKLRLGWSVARIDQSRANKIQCYKCWRFGHVATTCRSNEDRSKNCFRCGQTGHAMKNCNQKTNCVLCQEAGYDSMHRIGAYFCSMAQIGNRKRENFNVNLNRSFEAYEILIHYVKKFGYDIVFATEMPREPKLSGWYANELKTSFIYVNSRKLRPAPEVICKSRPQGSSVVDLTLCSDDITECISRWKVLKEENLSDHEWISWKFRFKKKYELKRNKYDYIRWKNSKLNEDLFVNILEWLPVNENLSPNKMAKRLETVVYDACSVSMSRSYMPGLKTSQVYWWNDVIEHERRKCELVDTLEEDPWGLPFKIVLNKLRRAALSITELLEEDTAKRLVNSLFPDGEIHDPIKVWRGYEWEEDTYPNVTIEEVKIAI
ncbi:uncharacterized protein [Cardiocondyla obscurior]|uniref:uncharacterized protein n=1 Tax=Cardiocondyla obscurior TaxID=286306 RepID=UPI0039657378